MIAGVATTIIQQTTTPGRLRSAKQTYPALIPLVYYFAMTLRDKLLNKYISKEKIADWFSYKKKPTVELIVSIFVLAAQDYKNSEISYSDFSLICTNLYFEGIVFLSITEERSINRKVITAIEAFADPHGHLLNPQGDVQVDKQNQLLDEALSYLNENSSE